MLFRQISEQARALLAGRRILLAEDEPFISMEIEDVIVENGAIFVGPFGDLNDLMRALGRESFDVVVLDVRLGVRDVFPAADQLAACGVPFVFHSGHADGDALRRRYPHVELCRKPCPAERVLEAAAAAFERAQAA
jgi:DNA-binding NtrC family response regulator